VTISKGETSHVLKIRCSRSVGGKGACGRVIGSVRHSNGLQLHWESWSSERCIKVLEHESYLRRQSGSVPDDWSERDYEEWLKSDTDLSVVLRYQRTLAPYQLGSGRVEIPLRCGPLGLAQVCEQKLALFWHERRRTVEVSLLT